jgi:prepilin-type N-terminal cleavage/methylation domain-containing protein
MLAMLSLLELLIVLVVGGMLLAGGGVIYVAMRRGARSSPRDEPRIIDPG